MFCSRISISSFARALAAVFLVAGTLTVPVSAQQVLVRNGGTVQVANQGVWDLHDAAMVFGEVGATAQLNEATGGRVTGGTLTATRALSSPSSADPAGLGAVLSASVDLGNVTITRGHTVQVASNGNASIRRFYDIAPSKNNSSLSATLAHSYHGAELNGLTEGNLALFKSTDGGTTWSEQGADSRDPGANAVTRSGIRSFSRWTLGSELSPLPVELASFEGTTSEEGVQLTWRTASETGNVGFRVQRSIETRRGASQQGGWKTIGGREGNGTTDQPHTYRFTDSDLPFAADVLSYRLTQVDVGGTEHTTDPITIERGGIERLALEKTFPNPARSQVTLRYAVPEKAQTEEVTVRLYDVLGRRVQTVVKGTEAGRHELHLSVDDLASGVYVLRLTAGEQTRTRRLTIVR